MTVELKSRLWVDHRSEKWTNNQPIKIEVIPLTSKRPPTSERPPYISLLGVKDKCFYLSTKWAFTGISGLLKKRPIIEINYENIKL